MIKKEIKKPNVPQSKPAPGKQSEEINNPKESTGLEVRELK